jgi:hypothetical protein
MGLSVKWARYNLGGSTPSSYGSYYSFADPQNKVTNGNTEYSYYHDNYNTFKQQFGNRGDSISGTQYDTAKYNWGNKWRMPTKAEFEELISNCDIEYIQYSNINGVKLKSKKNGNSIFLPLSGCKYTETSSGPFKLADKGEKGWYWTGDVYSFGAYVDGIYQSYYFFLYNGRSGNKISYGEMACKNTIRPVSTGSGSTSGCTGSSCSANCANNSTSSSCSNCGTGCSNGCKTTCTGACSNGCNTLCGGQCLYSCGGTCTYVSAGTKCTSCANTCSTYCYHACTLACSSSCMANCIYSSE